MFFDEFSKSCLPENGYPVKTLKKHLTYQKTDDILIYVVGA